MSEEKVNATEALTQTPLRMLTKDLINSHLLNEIHDAFESMENDLGIMVIVASHGWQVEPELIAELRKAYNGTATESDKTEGDSEITMAQALVIIAGALRYSAGWVCATIIILQLWKVS